MDRMAGFGGEDVARNNERAEGVSLFDARPFNGGDLPRFFPARQALDYPVLLTKLNDPEYHIGSGTRGKCVIFNYKVFATKKGVCERTGSDEDVRSLDLVFRELGYEIIIHKDLTKKTTLEELEKLRSQDYSQDDSFVCWIMTHGENGYLVASDGDRLTEENFMSPFREKKDLLGKPKLFFIQACRGDRVDKGQNVVYDSAGSSARTRRIPTHADFLVAYSTVPGFLSWREQEGGSWFVQAVCWVLEKSKESEDLLALLTVACRLVALQCAASTENPNTNGAKQVPYVTSTLTRRVRFPRRRQM